MGVQLKIEVETPLSDDDRDILAGISVMVLAIANRQNLADQELSEEEVPDGIGPDGLTDAERNKGMN
jgi:hypothetical protein